MSAPIEARRMDEARALANRLQAATAPIIVLYGAADSGKTEFIRGEVMPLLSRPVLYVDGKLPEIETAAAGGFILIDSFEKLLLSSDPTRDRSLSELLHLAQRKSVTLVVVVRQDHLSRLFQLQHALPQIMAAAYEIPSVSNERVFEGFVNALQQRGIRLASELQDALFRDLQSLSGRSRFSSQLLEILGVEFDRLKTRDREFTKDDYEACGYLTGMLDTHLDSLIESTSNKFEPQIVWAILNDVVRPSGEANPDLADIANRFDAQPEVLASILDWLENEKRLVGRDNDGRPVIYPRQLAAVVEARMDRERDREADDHLLLILRQGTRQFIESGEVLPESRFRKVHARRSSIRIGQDEAKLMLASALTYEDARTSGAIEHWRRRLKNHEDAVDVLLDCTFDSRPEVRQRAVAQLRQCKRPEVRNQLHLLALRDAAESVREQALESLCVIQDDALRNAFIQEAKDFNSPYRLRCIEGLKIFKDQETIQTLLEIVRNPTPADDSTARATAARVLGYQDVEQSADALLDIALRDGNRTNRQNASVALSLMKSEQAVQYTLEKLRVQKPASNEARPDFSARSILASAMNAAAAALVVGATVLLHGLMLFTLQRRRLAGMITAIEAVALLLILGTNSEEAGTSLFLATLAAGFLIPTRIVLVARRDHQSRTHYQRWLDRILFAADCVTTFLLLPGLAPMLAGRVRRGLVLLGIEGVGFSLWIGSYFFADRFAPFEPLSPVFKWVSWLMAIIGVALILIPFGAGVVHTLRHVFLMPRRREWLDRVGQIYAELVRNPVASRIVCAKFVSENRDEAKWAAQLVRRHERLLQGPLLQSWENATAAGRQKISSWLMRRPHADSLELLKRTAPAAGWKGNVQYGYALWNFRMAIWPRDLVIFGTLGLVALITFTTVLYAQYQNAPERLMARIQQPSLETSERNDAIMRLQLLANSKHAQVAPLAITGLSTILKNISISDDIRSSAIAALGKVSSSEAAMELREFIDDHDQRQQLRSQRRGAAPDADPELHLKMAAITAIASMQSLGGESLHQLGSIANNAALPKEIRNAAAKAVDPIALAEHKFDESEYLPAIADATAFLKESPEDPRTQQARNIIARANVRLATGAMNDGAHEEAKSLLKAAVNSKGDSSTAQETISLALNLAYEFHERRALETPSGYADTHEVLTAVQSLAEPESGTAANIQANLAEASLTLGKYDEALRSARILINSDKLDAETKLSVHLTAYAALVLKGDQSGASMAREQLLSFYASLPKDFSNHWSYVGTRNYIAGLNVPADRKQQLWTVFDKVESK